MYALSQAVGRRSGRVLVALLAAAVMLLAVALLAPSANRAQAGAAAGPPALRDLAAKPGLLVGSAVDMAALADDTAYAEVLAREFNSVTAENVMKWEAVEPNPGEHTFDEADALVDFAQANDQSVYGHVLVWHNQLPPWLAEGDFSPDELRAIMARHIAATAGHFSGKVRAWDVVNEPFNDDGTFRETIFLEAFGPDYIADALRLAHEADPHAKLFLNDFNLEGLGPKSDAMYELAKDLLAQGVPLDGVGIQGHLSLEFPFPEGYRENLRRFADLGLEIAITEADIRMPLPVTGAKLADQARYFRELIGGCLAVSNCSTFTVWGFTDAYSWVPGFFEGEGAATPFDEELKPKPAYRAIASELRQPAPSRKG
jgi:endo-1,4-beta-xylanase